MGACGRDTCRLSLCLPEGVEVVGRAVSVNRPNLSRFLTHRLEKRESRHEVRDCERLGPTTGQE